MLAGGLASAVKEYVRKFSQGLGKAVVMVSWALALMKIIKHNRALLFGSPLNCTKPWEIYADCSGPDTALAKEKTSPDIILGSDTGGPNGNVPDQSYPDYSGARRGGRAFPGAGNPRIIQQQLPGAAAEEGAPVEEPPPQAEGQ
ncbi:hypothetical protein R1flu_024616 [Riccia fluitans]|uniref:Uncharacterized protein n=1 Tax=Riccia fluitans TaxID=41844 RepID=A0ABD1XVF3_9MARC